MAGRDVFISFNEHDTAIAEALADALTDHGVSSWLFTRENLNAPGVSHLTQSHGGISRCRAFVLIASPTSVRSREVVIEVQQAHTQRKPIIVVRVNLTQDELSEAHPDVAMLAGTGTTLETTAGTVKAAAERIARSSHLRGSAGAPFARVGTGAPALAPDNPFRGSLDDTPAEADRGRYSTFHVHIRVASSPEATKLSQQIKNILLEQGFQVTVGGVALLDREGTFELLHPWLGLGTARDLQRLLDGVTWRGKKMSSKTRKNEGDHDLSRQITSFEIVVA